MSKLVSTPQLQYGQIQQAPQGATTKQSHQPKQCVRRLQARTQQAVESDAKQGVVVVDGAQDSNDLASSTYDASYTKHEPFKSEWHFARFQSDHSVNRAASSRVFATELLATFIYTYLTQCSLTSFELIGTQNDALSRQFCVIACHASAYLIALTFFQISSQQHQLPASGLNPALSLALATFKLIKWRSLPLLLAGQYLGALLAAPILHATYSDKILHRHEEGSIASGMNATLRAHGNVLSTGKFFASFPPTEVSLSQLFISYSLATCLFTLIYAKLLLFSNKKQHPASSSTAYASLAIFLVLGAFCANGGPVLNPALDFAPRLYISMFGWGVAAFNLYQYTYWWLCGILAPHFGALLGLCLVLISQALTRTSPKYQHQHQHQKITKAERQRLKSSDDLIRVSVE